MHTAFISVNVKKNKSAPVMIAPITLVAAKVMPKRIIEVKTVPKIPTKNEGKLRQTHGE